MTDAWLRGKFAAHACACVTAVLAVSLVVSPRTAVRSAAQSPGVELAEVNPDETRTSGVWFRLGDLLANLIRRDHGSTDDLQSSDGDRGARDVGRSLDLNVRSLAPSAPPR